jgi:thioesterase domain-containing protein
MQSNVIPRERGEDSATSSKTIGDRAKAPESGERSGPDEAKADFWSAAGAVFTQQNRIPRLTRCAQTGPIPLSLAQERIWMLEQSEQGEPYYHVPLTWKITGQLNIYALEKALNFLIQRHEILRTVFSEGPGGPRQQIRQRELRLPVVEASDLTRPGPETELLRRAREFLCAPFNLQQDFLFRATVYRRGTQAFWLVVAVHQMVFDGASMRVFSRELVEAYGAFCEGRQPALDPLPVRYVDFAIWQRQCLNGDLTDAATAFWGNVLQKRYEPLRFPIDHPRRNVGATPGAMVPLRFSRELMAGLKQLGSDLGVSSFASFLGAFQAFLARWTGQDDVMTLVSIAARNQADLRNVIGLVANVLPMRLDLSGGPGLAVVLERAGQMASAGLSHQILPLSRILEMLPSSNARVTAPALQVLIIYNNGPLPVLKFPHATFTPDYLLDNGTSRFDFVLDIADSPQGLVGHLKYRSDLFEKRSIEDLIVNWQTFLAGAVGNPALPIHSLPLVFEPALRPVQSASQSAQTDFVPNEAAVIGNLPQSSLAPPRNDLERKLHQIWERVFAGTSIGIHDNFFGLGGHSLLAVKILAAIERETGHKLPLCKIFQEPTIARLARAIEHKEAINGSSIVEIQPAGAKPPLFFVHGVGGGMFWGYSNLARQLGPDQPVYAFRSRGMEGLREFTCIEGIAASYVADLRRFQPEGPYHLGGYCFGGNVAYEMARQLRQQDQEVGLLLLMNCWPNNSSYTRLSFTPSFFVKAFWNFLIRLRHQIRSSAKQPRDFFKWRASWLRKRIKSFFSSDSTDRLSVDDIVDLSARPEHEQKLWRTHVAAWLHYQPKPYDGRVVLFRTRGHPLFCSYDHQMGWGSFAAKGVLVRICPGDHESILEEENVAHTARELKTVLAGLPSSEAAAEPAKSVANSAPSTPVVDVPASGSPAASAIGLLATDVIWRKPR